MHKVIKDQIANKVYKYILKIIKSQNLSSY